MRGYNYLKNNNQIGFVRQIKLNLAEASFPAIGESASKQIFGASLQQSELLVRQFLLQRNTGASLNQALLYSLGRKSAPIRYPLPKVWQEILIGHGFVVDQKLSTLAWMWRISRHWGHGALLIVQLTVLSVIEVILPKTDIKKRYAYFEGLSPANLPQPGPDGRSHDICTWYSRWEGRAYSLDALCHDVRDKEKTSVDGMSVEFIGRPYQPLKNIADVLRFVVWGLRAIYASALDASRGRWWHALVLAEAAKSKLIQLGEPATIATDYLFHYSGSIYRPMWTYEAEVKGSRILCYFYSTSEQVKLPEGYESQRYEWGAASWPTYLVWDKYQAALINSDTDKHATINVVGPIWFETSSTEPQALPENSIAVFDVQPHRKSAHFGFSTLADYVAKNPNVQTRFLEEIYTVFSEFGVTMAFKGKREIGNRAVKKYKNTVKRLSQSKDVVMVDPGISAIRVIEKCKGVVSMPFTSTALYLQDQGIPSVYYDPSGWIQKDDRGAHGIPILSGIQELREWVMTVSKETITTGRTSLRGIQHMDTTEL
jgi:polysaccharide biosynthesis PFTS motif protein